LRLLAHRENRDASRADCTAGSRSPTSTPMIATTTSSSTSVKPAAARSRLRERTAGSRAVTIPPRSERPGSGEFDDESDIGNLESCSGEEKGE
jgi:hypothetical protein